MPTHNVLANTVAKLVLAPTLDVCYDTRTVRQRAADLFEVPVGLATWTTRMA